MAWDLFTCQVELKFNSEYAFIAIDTGDGIYNIKISENVTPHAYLEYSNNYNEIYYLLYFTQKYNGWF